MTGAVKKQGLFKPANKEELKEIASRVGIGTLKAFSRLTGPFSPIFEEIVGYIRDKHKESKANKTNNQVAKANTSPNAPVDDDEMEM